MRASRGRERAGATRLRPLLCGYYGEHNLGDDALLAVLLEQLPPGTRPLVSAHDGREVRQRHGVATCPRRNPRAMARALLRCDALVLGGGSLLQDSSSLQSLFYYLMLMALARLRRIPVILWAQGYGPLHRPLSRRLVGGALGQVSAVSWRDATSAAAAERWRPGASRWAPDPVWSVPAGSWNGRGGDIVICWRDTSHLDRAGWRWLLDQLDALAAASDRAVLWLPFHRDQDSGLAERLEASVGIPAGLQRRSRSVSADSPEQAMDLFQRAGLVLAMRLHALILAAVSGAPVLAFSYDPKVQVAAAAAAIPSLDLAQVGSGSRDPDLWMRWQRQLDAPPDPARIRGLGQAAELHRRCLLQGLE
ncbi:polysaccharide pyruvyl transferase CsaB [Synechococcus sp. RSCCF101]|uniref:polysaccharide pyruvyl transferase CsaB n=1 Tax=Synechococcus sp. RSCCF101 TaxID=2511069 RepID=UPI001247FD32|nr:polysaccharide pyruvyl transferase CsaB [Synechococcus sp. RSCCF101]QEY31684.1 polysaccharide pyruvyl transferase CsaB [Synechococcus sp. RSCCF101]